MKLSLKLLHAEIAAKYPGTRFSQAFCDSSVLSSSAVITPASKPSDDVVYIYLSCFDVPADFSHASVVVNELNSHRFTGSNLVVVPDDADMLAIPEFVASVFTRYFRWSDSLYEAIARNSDLQDLIDLTAPLLNQPMYFADSSWKMVAYWGGDMEYVNPTWSYQMKYAYLPYHVYQDIIDADDMAIYHESPEAVICKCRPGFGSLPFVSKAIRKDGKHYGNFFVISLYRELDARDLNVAEHLGNVVSTALYGGSDFLETSTLYSSHFIIDSIEGNLASDALMADQLHALGWSLSGDYALALIDMKSDERAIVNHMTMKINEMSYDVNCFVYKCAIVAVFNDFRKMRDLIEERFRNFACSYNAIVSIADPFERFEDIRNAYEQAKYTLQNVKGKGVERGLVTFADCFLDYLAQRSADMAPAKLLVQILLRHDAEFKTDYCRTLYEWLLNERSVVETASVLFIHRNTLKNRLSSIEKLLGCDFANPSVRLQLVLGLHDVVAREG